MEGLEEILIAITQAEIGQRGYILTGDEKYQKPLESGVKNVRRGIERFRELTVDNPRQQEDWLLINQGPPAEAFVARKGQGA